MTNPGGMMGDFLVRGKVKPHGSVLRNPVMAEVFYMAGMMEIGEHQKGALFSKAEYMKHFSGISKITAQSV